MPGARPTLLPSTALLALLLTACSGVGPRRTGLEAAVRTGGRTTGVLAEWDQGPLASAALLAGYQDLDRGSRGEHDDESGGGPGVGVEARRYLGDHRRGWFVGARADLWFLTIDWEDRAPARRGTSEIVVLQPTARVGYRLVLDGGAWCLDLHAAGGGEFHLETDGEAVGEDALVLLGVTLAFGF